MDNRQLPAGYIEYELESHTKYRLLVVHVINDLYVYKHTFGECCTTGGKSKIKSGNEQGVCKKAKLKMPFQWDNTESFSFMKKPGREALANWGWFGNLGNGYSMIDENRPDCPFDAFISGEVTVEDLVCLRSYDHTLFDANLKILPIAMRIGYIDGRLNSEHYDLVKAVGVLLKRKDVTFLTERGDVISKPTPGNVIQDIPWYNNDSGKDRSIELLYRPTQEDMERIYEHSMKGRERRKEVCPLGLPYLTFKEKLVMELDLLGLAECRKHGEQL